MRFPWKRGEKEELRESLEELEEEKMRLEKRFEAEKERRAELARKKQEAEEELNRLRDRLRSLEENGGEEEEKTDTEKEELGFEQGYRLIQKLDSVGSPDRDLVTVYSPEDVNSLDDYKGLKNALSSRNIDFMQGEEGFAGFFDEEFFRIVLKTRPFFEADWSIGREFEPGKLLDFIEEEKTWALVSAGDTRIIREKAGEVEELERVKNRIDREHSKGGYSQSRFERKRDEQVKEHLEEGEEALQGFEDVHLLGPRELCSELPGEHLGGFDPNQGAPGVLYGFSLVR